MAKDYVYYLFDFDLTLADSSRGIVMCFTNVLQRHGFFDVTELQIKRTIGKTLEESFAILTGISDPAQLSALKQEYTKEADIYMNDNTVLFPETVEVLTKLKNDGAKLAIISTKYRYRIQAVIDKHFIRLDMRHNENLPWLRQIFKHFFRQFQYPRLEQRNTAQQQP